MRKFKQSSSSKRRKEEEEENQRVYEEFVKSFNEDSSSSMTFVRGGVQNASSSSKTSQNVIFLFRVSTHLSFSKLDIHTVSLTNSHAQSTHPRKHAGRGVQDGRAKRYKEKELWYDERVRDGSSGECCVVVDTFAPVSGTTLEKEETTYVFQRE